MAEIKENEAGREQDNDEQHKKIIAIWNHK